MERPDIGEEFTAEISSMSDSGNGLIEAEPTHINIGPILSDAVGTEVKCKMETWLYARCMTEGAIHDNYDSMFDSLVEQFKKNDRRSDLEEDRTKGNSNSETVDSKNNISTKRTESDSQSNISSNIETLRRQAEEAATEEVSEAANTATQSKPQYSRSEKIKEYVKARADGVCEGCGEPAPFTSKTGKPYLHAHHIHELSQGGSDAPDTVVSLCPNCHYRVHHGRDGDEYNQRLLEIVRKKES